MKNNKRKLDLLLNLKIIDLSDFYTMSITDYGLTLQGSYASQVLEKYIKKSWKFEIDNAGHAVAKRKNITISFL